MPGPYQLVAIRGEVQVFRADFDDRVEATRALADALVRYPDCEVRLTSGDGVLISAGADADAMTTSAGVDGAAIR